MNMWSMLKVSCLPTYSSDLNTHVLTHSNSDAIGMIIRKGDALTSLQNMIKEKNNVFNTGILVSPASKKL